MKEHKVSRSSEGTARRVTKEAAPGLAGVLALTLSIPAYAAPPTLSFSKGTTRAPLVAAYNLALANLLDINTVTFDPAKYNSTGLMTTNPQLYIVAGAEYPEPWTRDNAINSMAAASLLEPVVAENTLWAVCTGSASASTLILVDGGNDQWWDQSIWAIAAWNHYGVTGDRKFLANAEQVSRNSMAWSEANHFDATRGLFQGPAHFNDGVAGYPVPPATNPEGSSAATDYSGTLTANTLSVNVLSYQAYLSLALMADELGVGGTEASDARTKATALAAQINSKMWQPSVGRYGYLLHGDDSMKGQLDPSQEGTGTAMAVLYGVASPTQIAAILKNVAIAPQGIVDVYPHFARYDDAHPGRHNVSVWPMVQGVWAHAVASVGADWLFRPEVEHLATNAMNPKDPDHVEFREVYEFQTGLENGGYQCGGNWNSAKDQTWSATAFLRMIYSGLFGMTFEPSGIQFAPVLPYGWGDAELSGLSYRGATLDIKLTGAGTKIASFAIDGVASTTPQFASSMTGSHTIEIAMTAALENVAATATVTASGTASGFATAGLTDGQVNGAPVDQEAEWAAPATPATGAWVRMDWARPTTIRKVRIFDRVNSSDQVTAGHLDMSDGSTMMVPALQNDGETPWDVDFPDRTVTWVRFTVDSVSSTTTNPGLAEFEVHSLVPPAEVGPDGGAPDSGIADSGVADSGSANTADAGGDAASGGGGDAAASEGPDAGTTGTTTTGSCKCAVLGGGPSSPGAGLEAAGLLGIAYLARRRRRGSRFLLVASALSLPGLARADQAADAFNAWNTAFLVQNGNQTYYATTDITAATIRSGTWVGALDIAVAEDRYQRTHDAADRKLISDLLTTFIAAEGTDWHGDTWDDDLAWMVIAVLRGYQITGDASLLTTAELNWNTAYDRGWDTRYAGGGVWEDLGHVMPTFNQPSKCCLSNNPLIKMGLILYEMTGDAAYLSKCEAMYAWIRKNLFDAKTGLVNECVAFHDASDTTGFVQTSDNTYNSGSFLEAADDLYRVTGDMSYYQDALLAITHRITTDAVLHVNVEGESEPQWAYRFVKGLTEFANYSDDWAPYQTWLQNNANAAWSKRDALNITWNDWSAQTPMPMYADVHKISATDVVPMATSSAAAIWQMLPPWNAPPFSGDYELQNAGSHLSLDGSGSGTVDGGAPDAGSADGPPVVQATFDGSAGFLWSFVPASGGYYRIQNAASGLYLTVQTPWAKIGAGVVTSAAAPHGLGTDKWLPVSNSDGTTTFYNLASVMALDVPAASTAAGTPLDQWAGNSTPAQAFTLISHVLAPDAGADAAAGDDGGSSKDAGSVAIDGGSGPGEDASAGSRPVDGAADAAQGGSASGTSSGCACTAGRRSPTPGIPALVAVASLAAVLRVRRRSARGARAYSHAAHWRRRGPRSRPAPPSGTGERKCQQAGCPPQLERAAQCLGEAYRRLGRGA